MMSTCSHGAQGWTCGSFPLLQHDPLFLHPFNPAKPISLVPGMNSKYMKVPIGSQGPTMNHFGLRHDILVKDHESSFRKEGRRGRITPGHRENVEKLKVIISHKDVVSTHTYYCLVSKSHCDRIISCCLIPGQRSVLSILSATTSKSNPSPLLILYHF